MIAAFARQAASAARTKPQESPSLPWFRGGFEDASNHENNVAKKSYPGSVSLIRLEVDVRKTPRAQLKFTENQNVHPDGVCKYMTFLPAMQLNN